VNPEITPEQAEEAFGLASAMLDKAFADPTTHEQFFRYIIAHAADTLRTAAEDENEPKWKLAAEYQNTASLQPLLISLATLALGLGASGQYRVPPSTSRK